jgi:hypothetical protein
MSALDKQIGGEHYKTAKIQPVQYIEANGLLFLEGCVVKRVTRHDKPTGKGRQDIEKAIHELQLLLELRYGEARAGTNVNFGLAGTTSEIKMGFLYDPTAEPASEIDDDSPRQQAIAQNGNDGAHYDGWDTPTTPADLVVRGVCPQCEIDQHGNPELHYVGCPNLTATREFQAAVDTTMGEVFGEPDMSDWRNWLPGDVVECVNGDGWLSYDTGANYVLSGVDDRGFGIDGGDQVDVCKEDFKWHSRPAK